MKVNISINDDLLARLDSYAKDNYSTRSGLISMAVTEYLNAQMASTALRDISLTLRQVASTGVLDDDSAHKLAEFETLVSMLAMKGR